MRVLDLGCGTGTLTILAKKVAPGANVTGLNGDPQVRQIAQDKAAQTGVQIEWDRGMAFDLPYPDNTFERVLTSLVYHHLSTDLNHGIPVIIVSRRLGHARPSITQLRTRVRTNGKGTFTLRLAKTEKV